MSLAGNAESQSSRPESVSQEHESELQRADLGGGVTRLILNAPKSRNALSENMIAALSHALADIAQDRSVRVVILSATGPAFSAGHHLKELTAHRSDPDRGRAYFQQIMTACSAMMRQIIRLPQPVIAEVLGTATAAGCQLVATCDLAVAADTAQFATPGVNIGLFCSTPMVAITRNLTPKHAMEMLLLGEMVSAHEAHRMGLINRVVSHAHLSAETECLARQIASKSALTVKTGKAAFYIQRELGVAEAYDYAARVMTENMLARDAEEGISAFIDKRAPLWEDR